MRTNHRLHVCRTAFLALLSAVAVSAAAPKPGADAEAAAPNTLTNEEIDAGWTLLFDGKSTDGWRGYKAVDGSVPPSWKVVEGSLVSMPKEGESLGHLVTVEEYDDFELSVDWKVVAGGNSGIMYRVTEEMENPWDSGPEYQILDNTGHLDGNNPLASASACYAVYPPAKDLTKPVGEWNTARVVAEGAHVEHWLNGEKVLEYDVGSADWQAHVKTSRFWATPNWGRAERGHICVQDYGNAIEYRNVKIRPVSAE